MNLTDSPSHNELRKLLASVEHDGPAQRYILWVDVEGGVHLDLLESTTPKQFASERKDKMKFRLESLPDGTKGYVGIEASKDDKWVSDLFRVLTRAWKNGCRNLVDY